MQVDLHINFPTRICVLTLFNCQQSKFPGLILGGRCQIPERWLVKVKVDSGYGKEVKTE